MENLNREISTEEQLLELLSEMNSFEFHSVSFKSDIDFYALLENNPLDGIMLLPREKSKAKSPILKQLHPEFDISNLRFNKPVSFVGCEFHIPLAICKSTMDDGVVFRNTVFRKGLDFYSSTIEGVSTFGFKSEDTVIIHKSSFRSLKTEFTKLEITGSLRIIDSVFHSELNFQGCIIGDQLQIEGKKFSDINLSAGEIGSLYFGSQNEEESLTEIGDLILSEAKIEGSMKFSNLKICGKVLARSITFNEGIFLTNVELCDKSLFHHCVFHKGIYSQKVVVRRLINFYGSTFHSVTHFTDIDLSAADIILTATNIKADLWLGTLLHKDSVSYTGNINFEGSMIATDSVVRIFNLNRADKPAGSINYKNAVIKGLLDIRNVYIEKITLEGTVTLGNIQDNGTIYSAVLDRNSARLLKHEAKRINNMISAIAYYKLEMRLHTQQVSFKQFSDKLTLILNRCSNNFGTNWLQAVFFTFVSGLFCYSIFVISKTGFGFFWQDNWIFLLSDTIFWSGFINYFWLPTGFTELAKFGKVFGGFFGAFFFILGKIIIAYGIYQTISAFRKFV